ncbi:MAG: hypothetical protein ACI9KE_001955 [Polyangiales bacterium]|jgi:hypothetical protein
MWLRQRPWNTYFLQRTLQNDPLKRTADETRVPRHGKRVTPNARVSGRIAGQLAPPSSQTDQSLEKDDAA